MKNLLYASILSSALALTGCTEEQRKFTIDLLTTQTAKKCENTLFWEKCEKEEVKEEDNWELWKSIEKIIDDAIANKITTILIKKN